MENHRSQFQAYPLLRYAAQYWRNHLVECSESVIGVYAFRLLSKEGCVSTALMVRSRVSYSYDEGSTALHLAARFGLYTCAFRFLEKDPDTMENQGPQGWTAVNYAVSDRKLEIF